MTSQHYNSPGCPLPAQLRAVMDNCSSSMKAIPCGVPQGSITISTSLQHLHGTAGRDGDSSGAQLMTQLEIAFTAEYQNANRKSALGKRAAGSSRPQAKPSGASWKGECFEELAETLSVSIFPQRLTAPICQRGAKPWGPAWLLSNSG